MRAFILLLKVQLLGLFGINKALHANPERAKRTLGLVVLVMASIVALASAYVGGVATSLIRFGLGESIPLIAVLAGSLAGAVAAFLKANGVFSVLGITTWSCRCRCPQLPWCCRASRRCTLWPRCLAFW